MTTIRETACVVRCDEESLIGIVCQPDDTPKDATGVLIVVGGPQYRIGCHRSFVKLARRLASQGIPTMRFDVRGMGDATGEHPSFTELDSDIAAALDAFFDAVPTMRSSVLWGLCDGASAACLFDPEDPRVRGLVLVNPWIRTPETQARTDLRRYYAQRILDGAFWSRLASGQVNLRRSLSGFLRTAKSAVRRRRQTEEESLIGRMARSIAVAGRSVAIALSEDDLVAQEFEDFGLTDPVWHAQARPLVWSVDRLAGTDHTLSTEHSLELVADATERFVRSVAEVQPGGA